MATYIVLGSFTDQGIRAVKDTTKRAEALRGVMVRRNPALRGECHPIPGAALALTRGDENLSDPALRRTALPNS